MRRPTPRRGFTLLELLLVILIIGALAAIATPTGCGRRGPANRRACFANQKTIAGAIEMYNLDFGTHVTRLTPALARELESQGYLQQFPRDPGGQGQYRLTPLTGNGVSCTEHGPIQGPRSEEAWAAFRRGKLEEVVPRLGGSELTLVLRELREASEAELQRARLQGMAFGGGLGMAVSLLGWLILRICLLPLARTWTGEGPPAPAPGCSGVLQILATRGLGPSWPACAPDVAATCPVCAEGFGERADAPASCPSCLAPHHRECREFNQGCGIYACGQR